MHRTLCLLRPQVIAKEAREEVQDRAAAKVPGAGAFTDCYKFIGLPGVVGLSGLVRLPTGEGIILLRLAGIRTSLLLNLLGVSLLFEYRSH